MGTNDAATTFQGIPVDRYRNNLTKMIELAASHKIHLVLVGPALHQERENQKYKGFSSSRATKIYSDAAEEVAAAHNVPFVDLWNAFQKDSGYSKSDLLEGNPDLEKYLVDGIHFSPQGYKVFYDELTKVIFASYPHLVPEKLEMAAPRYDAMDYSDVRKSILDYIT